MLALATATALSGCGSVLQGTDPDLADQQAVTAPAELPAPVASAPRVGASDKTNYLTGEDVPDGEVLAVKLDNTASGRPVVGLGEADVVYVEEVEGGVTRLLALFQTELPGEVGPVRSARTSDIYILGSYDAPALAISGANAGVVDELAAADLGLVSYDLSREGWARSQARQAPYNLMADPRQLLERAAGVGVATDVGFRFGPLPAGAAPASGASYEWERARIDFEWSGEEGRWLQSMDGSPSRTADGERVGADTVVFQQVPVVPSAYVDVTGSRSPEVRPVGEGTVHVLRDGQVVEGRWSRPDQADPTTFTTADGEPLTFDVGVTWVVYVEEGTAPTLR